MYEARQNKEKVSRRIDGGGGTKLRMINGVSPCLYSNNKMFNNRNIIQRIVVVSGQNLEQPAFEKAFDSALKSDVQTKLTKINKKKIWQIRTKLLQRYVNGDLNLVLNDSDSLTHQVAQDIILSYHEYDKIVGVPHQYSDYMVNPTERNPGHVNTDMRIYRSMPLYAWNEAKLQGHGGSLGEAMHYFNRDKNNSVLYPNQVFVLVEFKIRGKTLNEMVTSDRITRSGEGTYSDKNFFGGKYESTSLLPQKNNNFFSVDLSKAKDILHSNDVISTIIASTKEISISPSERPGTDWEEGIAIKPSDWNTR